MTLIDTRARQRLAEQVGLEVQALTKEVFLNSVLGAQWMPRPLRALGYRLAGVQTRTANIFAGLSIHGSTANLTIGPGSFLNHDCYIEVVGPVIIGADCQLGPQVCILTSHHPWTVDGRISKIAEPRGVRIGDRAWIGGRALLIPGVTVGADVVIGAGAVVTRDCLTPGVYAGVPARWIGPPRIGDAPGEDRP